ncbi:hypothetical protein ACPA9J_16140 [Pseudomonas aeruginosa]
MTSIRRRPWARAGVDTAGEAASMQQTIDCPIRRRLAHLPWSSDGRAGVRHWLEMQRDPLAWLQKMHVAQPDLAVVRTRAAAPLVPVPSQAVQELMVDRRDEPATLAAGAVHAETVERAQLHDARGRPRPGPAQEVRPHLAPPPASEVRRLAAEWGERVEEGANTTSTWNAAFSVTLQRSRAVRRRPATVGLSDRHGGAPACRGWHCWK